MPDPDPAPTDLEATQTAAADAAAAAMTASTNAATSASGAAAATENIATLQTGGMAAAHADAALEAAGEAAEAATEAEAASVAAAAATTGAAAEEAWAMADAAQKAAEMAETTATKMAMAAVEAAMTELHIADTVKTVGDSTIDADMGMLTNRNDDGDVTMTVGAQDGSHPMRAVAAIAGRAFDDNDEADAADTPGDTSDDASYRQAVAAGSVQIGKTLDTTDDKARVTLIHSREDTESVRVYGMPTNRVGIIVTTNADGSQTATRADGNTAVPTPTLRSIGTLHLAANPVDGSSEDGLVAMDVVPDGTTGDEVFSYLDSGTDNTAGGTDDIVTHTVETERTVDADGTTAVTYMSVDLTAPSAPDNFDDGMDPQEGEVTANIPAAALYEHIHFGVWASLVDNEDGDNSVIGDLGIGFVQNFSKSGVTSGHVTGTATYSGDWVAVVRPMHSTSLGSETGSANLTANFSTDEFTGDLVGLAMLEGTLSSNEFEGTDATVDHADMDSSGTFDGSFSGAIYGPDGAEAAGVFSFDGGDAGAFVGAFGGRDDEQ